MNSIKNYAEKILQLIAKDQLQEAIQETQQLMKGSPLYDEAILQSARYHDIMQQIRLGTVDFENAAIEKNKIRYALMDMVRVLEENANENPALHTEVETYLKAKEGNNLNHTVITGNDNINLQNVSGSSIHIQKGNTTNQQADKIYNIDQIDQADFT